VRRLVREQKGKRERARARLARMLRVRTQAAFRHAVWALDATQVGRDARGGTLWAEVLREVASSRTLSIRVGRAATAAEVIALLEQVAEERGGLPAVLVTDNGGPYVSAELEQWLPSTAWSTS